MLGGLKRIDSRAGEHARRGERALLAVEHARRGERALLAVVGVVPVLTQEMFVEEVVGHRLFIGLNR